VIITALGLIFQPYYFHLVLTSVRSKAEDCEVRGCCSLISFQIAVCLLPGAALFKRESVRQVEYAAKTAGQ